MTGTWFVILVIAALVLCGAWEAGGVGNESE